MPSNSSPRRPARSVSPRRLITKAALTVSVWGAILSSRPTPAANFGDDIAFLKSHATVVVLSDKAGQAKVALVPAMQGRVMTSTARGDAGGSFGWINRDLIAARKTQPHINVFGGEDRFWMGPEGGQFSIFFAKGAPFDLAHWFTPPAMDTEAFELTKQTRTRAEFRHRFALTNFSGTQFDVSFERTVELLSAKDAWRKLGLPENPDVALVAFESNNRVRNAGHNPWQPNTGLVSIWILGMFNPSPTTTIVVPFRPGPEGQLGKAVTCDYFGPIPPDRLVEKKDVAFFSGDGRFRSKIGINPRRSRGVLGSYDTQQHVLTLVQFTQPKNATNYVNSLWKIQDQPYAGDVANSYNDGPPSPGAKPLGPFYEMESSSPAAALEPGKTIEHVHRTIHLSGTEAQLDPIARTVLGVDLEEIAQALP